MSQVHAAVNNDGGVGGGAGSELAAIFARRRSKLNNVDDSKEKEEKDCDGDDYVGEDVAEDKSAYRDGRVGGQSVGQLNVAEPGIVGSSPIKAIEKGGPGSAATGSITIPAASSMSTAPTTNHAHTLGARVSYRMPSPSFGGDGNADVGNDINETHNHDEDEGHGVLGVTPRSFNNNLSSPLMSMFSKKKPGSNHWIVAQNDEESSVVSAITLQSAIVPGGGYPQYGSPPKMTTVDGDDLEFVCISNNDDEEANKENSFLAKARRGLRRAASSPLVHFPAQDPPTLSPQMERQEEDENEDEEKKGEDNDDEEEIEVMAGNSNGAHSSTGRQQWLPKTRQQGTSAVLNRWGPRNSSESDHSENNPEKNEVNSTQEVKVIARNTSSSNNGGRVGAAPLQMSAAPFSAVNKWNVTKNAIKSAPSDTAADTNMRLDTTQSSAGKDASNGDVATNERTVAQNKLNDGNITKKGSNSSTVFASAKRWGKRAMTPTTPVAEVVSKDINKVNNEMDAFVSSPVAKSVASFNVDTSATTNTVNTASASPGSVRNAAKMWEKKPTLRSAHSATQEGQQNQQAFQRDENGHKGVGSTGSSMTKTMKMKLEVTRSEQSEGTCLQMMEKDAVDGGGNSSGDVSNTDAPVTAKPQMKLTIAQKIHQLHGGSVGKRDAARAGPSAAIEDSTKGKSEGWPQSNSASKVGRYPPQELQQDEDDLSKAANPRRPIDRTGTRHPTLSSKNCISSSDRGVLTVETEAMVETPLETTTPVDISKNDDAATIMSSSSMRSSRSGDSRRNPNEKLLTIAKMSLRRTPRNKEESLEEGEEEEEENEKCKEEKEEIQATTIPKLPYKKALRMRNESKKATGTSSDNHPSIKKDNVADLRNEVMPSMEKQNLADSLKEKDSQLDDQSETSTHNVQPPPMTATKLSQRMRSKLPKTTKVSKSSDSKDFSEYKSSQKRLDELDQVVAKTADLISPQDDLSHDKNSLFNRLQKSRGRISNGKSNTIAAGVSKPTSIEPTGSSTTKVSPILTSEATDNECGSVSCSVTTPRAGGNLSSRRAVKPRWQAAARKKRDSTASVGTNGRGSSKPTEKKEISPKAEKTKGTKISKTTGVCSDRGAPKENDDNIYSSTLQSKSRFSAQNNLRQKESESLSQSENPNHTRNLSVDSITGEMRPRNKEHHTTNSLITPLQSQLKTISNEAMSQDEESMSFLQHEQDHERADSSTESVDSITCEMRVLPKPEGVEYLDGDEKLGHDSFSKWQQDEITFPEGKNMQNSAEESKYSQPLQCEFSNSFETWETGLGSFGGKPFPSPHTVSPANGPSSGGNSSAFEVRSKSVNSTGPNVINSQEKNALNQPFNPVSPTSTELRSENYRLHEEVLTLRKQLKEKDDIIAKLETRVNMHRNSSNTGHKEENTGHPPPKMHDKILKSSAQSGQLHAPLPKSPFETSEFQIAPTTLQSPGQGVMVAHRRPNHSKNDRRFLC